jgi:hypothetical protein
MPFLYNQSGSAGKTTKKRRRKKKAAPTPRYGSAAATQAAERPGSSSRVSNPQSIRSYHFLNVNAGVDWQHVNPRLLVFMNSLGKSLNEVITITSGFRSHAKQRELYYSLKAQNPNAVVAQPGHSMHETGNAVDALVRGQPIGDVVPESVFAKYGFKSLASIGDPVHVEIAGPTNYAPNVKGNVPVSAVASGSGSEIVADQAAGTYAPPGNTTPDTYSPQAVLPFEANPSEAPLFNPQQRADTWQMIAQLPGSSPETQQYARLARTAAGY